MSVIDEQLVAIQTALRLQNYRVKQKIKEKQEFENNSTRKLNEAINKFDLVRKYSKNILVQKLDKLPENKRYKFIYTDNLDDYSSREISRYFKITIENIVLEETYFIVVTMGLNEFTVKCKKIHSDDDSDGSIINIPLSIFYKQNLLKIATDYILEKI